MAGRVNPSTDTFDAMGVQDCAASLRGADVPFDAARWQALVDGFSLAPHLQKKMFMLSTGSKRKVWLAAALASKRPLTLLDEPTAGLDLAGREELVAALGAVGDSGPPTVLVTHHVEEIPVGSTHVLLVRGGSIVDAGPIDDVLTPEALSATFGLPLELERRGERWTAWSR